MAISKPGDQFMKIVERDKRKNLVSDDCIMIGSKWFPLANFDYYAASPSDMRSFGIWRFDKYP